MLSRNSQIALGSVLAFMLLLSLINMFMRLTDKRKSYLLN